MPRLRTVRSARTLAAAALAALIGSAGAHDPAPTPPRAAADLERTFGGTVRPFLQTYCLSCHGGAKPKGDLDLGPFTTLGAVTNDLRRWELVLERLRVGDMPPESAKKQPAKELRTQVIDWAEAVRRYEGDRNAGDPGPVPARRLSNAEYDNTVRDLTGVDLRPAREFPVDPANEAGFDNSAESLATSPALVKKYLEAARRVSNHMVFTPDGFAFAPHPAVAVTDRDKFCVNRIVAFYKRQPTDYADYFLAAWQYRNRAALGRPAATLADAAGDAGVSAKYLATVWAVLTEGREEAGPVAALRALWRELPDGAGGRDAARAGCERMRDFVADLRAKLAPTVKNLTAPRISNGSQPLVLWKNRQMAANRTRYGGGAAAADLKLPPGSAAARAMTAPRDPAASKRYEAACERFCRTFPDAFYVSERARVYLDPKSEKKLTGRLLSAGFHNQMGYFRDDGPLSDLILDDAGRAELDRLWREFDFASNAPVRQYLSFIWYERAESNYLRDRQFDEFRAEDKDATNTAKMRKLLDLYIAKAERAGASETALTAIRDYFRGMGETFRRLEKEHKEAQPRHLAALLRFAERAYRRPLTGAERDGLTRFYRVLRDEDGLDHESAVRDCVVSVLLSPHFCFRVDLPGPGGGPGTAPLSDYALASRLSYFLWASMPDAELLGHAAAGDLRKPGVLAAQARRMLRDPKARGLATEFAGNWLDFRRFEEHNAVDRARFPAFDSDLRRAMFEEPVRFFADLAARDGSVLDFLYADHTFVNPPLARHYGMPVPAGGPDSWARVDGAGRFGRGGLLPMAVFLTKNAPGLRTSPVKRGYWVARRVLGERIPPPPATVPDLPADEAKLELPLRDALAKHREDKSCAGCHQRFDSLGLVFEGYGPVGERRTRDFGGRPIDARADFPGGGAGEGVAGLAAYIRERRQREFVDNLCRKLLAYGLGRSPLPSDERLVRETRAKLEAGGYRFSLLVEAIITSPQFLNKRGEAAPQ